MNRPDIAAFVLGVNSVWMLIVAGIMTLVIRRSVPSEAARTIRDFLVIVGVGFGLAALALFAWRFA